MMMMMITLFFFMIVVEVVLVVVVLKTYIPYLHVNLNKIFVYYLNHQKNIFHLLY